MKKKSKNKKKTKELFSFGLWETRRKFTEKKIKKIAKQKIERKKMKNKEFRRKMQKYQV